RVEPAPEAADRLDLDVGQGQIGLEAIGDVVVAARHQADRDGHAAQILRPADARVRAHVDRVARHAVGVGYELPHAGAGVAHAAPRARVADRLRALEERLVLRPELVAAAPRLHLTEVDVPHHLGIEALGAEVALLEGDPFVEPHAGGKDADLREGAHRFGDGNTAGRGLSIQVYHRAHDARSAARQRADARRRLRPRRDRIHAHLRRAELAPPGARGGLHGRRLRGPDAGARRLPAVGDARG